jgi:uncharacterized membrane protein (UPF0127 family)
MKLAALMLAAAALTVACAAAPGRTPALFPSLQQAKVQATTATGTHEFAVWIAADAKSRERGLMYVRDMPPDRGMLFVFEFPQVVAFWMKDTYIPLDLVFLAEDGTVLNVAANAKPLSLDPIESEGDALAVLELRGGTAKKIGLKAGDRLQLPSLRTTGASLPATGGRSD